MELDKLHPEITACTKCALRKGCKQVVPGQGTSDASIFFVGEAPGREEDEQGLPFVGRSGRYLRREFQRVEIPPDLIYITNAHGRMSPVYAVKLSATGDISLQDNESSNKYVAWSYPKGGNYMTTPIVWGDYLYCCSNSGKLSCFNATTGELVYREGLGSSSVASSASPVAADGKIYFPGEKGDVYVVKAGPEFKVLAVNKMYETCMATPAISYGTLFFRTRNYLVAVAEPKE